MAAFGDFLRLQRRGHPCRAGASRRRRSAMKRIVTIIVMMLIGCYGAAHAQDEQAIQTEQATKEFLGLKWGMGVGVMGGFGGDRAVEKASIDANNIVRVDEAGDLRPQLFLEMHVFLANDKARCWRDYQRKKAANQIIKARKLGVPLTW